MAQFEPGLVLLGLRECIRDKGAIVYERLFAIATDPNVPLAIQLQAIDKCMEIMGVKEYARLAAKRRVKGERDAPADDPAAAPPSIIDAIARRKSRSA